MRRLCTACVAMVLAGLIGLGSDRPTAVAQDPFNAQLLRSFTSRNLGPFRMGA